MLTIGDFNSFWVFLGHPVLLSVLIGFPFAFRSHSAGNLIKNKGFLCLLIIRAFLMRED